MPTERQPGTVSDAVAAGNAPLGSDDEHDRSLICERLAWTPEQRLDANTAFLRFYLAVRPDGPLIAGDR